MDGAEKGQQSKARVASCDIGGLVCEHDEVSPMLFVSFFLKDIPLSSSGRALGAARASNQGVKKRASGCLPNALHQSLGEAPAYAPLA